MSALTQGQTITFEYTGGVQSITLNPGQYLFECYGASGGGNGASLHQAYDAGGLGGYTKALMQINIPMTIYVYVGGAGFYGGGSSPYGGPTGGWNGGGHGGNNASGSGGGATDFRLIGGPWNDDTSLKSRFIVAGGGGGADNTTNTYEDDGSGGSGGGLVAQGAWVSGVYNAAYAGTQQSGGGFGYGESVNHSTDCGGAGGGWYGGLSTQHNNGGAGGGSSYIKGYDGCNTAYLEYQTNVEYIDDGVLEIGGRNGHGCAQITCIQNSELRAGDTIVFEYAGTIQSIFLNAGRYKLECYGASGGIGNGNTNPIGKGGYVAGELTLMEPLTLYIHVGQDGVNNWATAVRYNGGGAAANISGHNGGAGGGATDFRLSNAAWNDLESLKTRILVAGGGGGAQSNCGSTATAGHGGNLIGLTSYNQSYQNRPAATAATRAYSKGGTQDAGGTGYNVNDSNTHLVATGAFGSGANSVQCGAGGGGGWYGGGSAYTSGGGGGSSYAAGYPECNDDYQEQQQYIVLQNVVFEQGINTGNGLAIVTVLALASEIRKNSNFYKDATLQPYYDIARVLTL